MIDHSATTRGDGELRMHWIEVVDPSGRAHLEARWSVDGPLSHHPDTAPAQAGHAA